VLELGFTSATLDLISKGRDGDAALGIRLSGVCAMVLKARSTRMDRMTSMSIDKEIPAGDK